MTRSSEGDMADSTECPEVRHSVANTQVYDVGPTRIHREHRIGPDAPARGR
jgi:hypothetical protein